MSETETASVHASKVNSDLRDAVDDLNRWLEKHRSSFLMAARKHVKSAIIRIEKSIQELND